MKGWWGKILRVDLSNKEVNVDKYSEDVAKTFIGGRGLAVKTLWEEVKNVDPLSPENKLIFAAGPLNGLTTPSNGKLVVASKSPLTGGYGEGNLGSRASIHLRKAGYDALVIEGKSDEPVYLHIEDDEVNILSADGLWGLNTFETEDKLTEVHGKDTGVLNIGPGGENLVKYSVVISQKGRSGGRPGMGAVMGSKNLKAVVLKGNKDIPVANEEKLQEIATEGYKTIKSKPEYDFWIRQGTMAASQWTNDNDALPTRNFKEGTFEFSRSMDGYAMEGMKVDRKGCPNCSMQCGNVVLDHEGNEAELDYENVALLGSNLGIGQLNKISVLNRIADQMGLDTISLGNTIGFLMEANEEGLIDEGPSFGDYQEAVELAKNIAQRKGKLGDIGAEGVKKVSEEFGGKENAMHVKGLEISGYNCFIYPGMALAFGTCSIGAHHKEAWVIATEIGTAPMEEDREESKYQVTYDEDIIDEVIRQQRLKGGMFESLTACRLPWIELGFDLDWYLKYLEAATGIEYTMEDMYEITDRVRSLTRSYWIREFEGDWDRELDHPPKRWFKEGLKKGEHEGMKLDEEKYEEMLSTYYEKRGWDQRGVPTKKTLEKQELEFVISELEEHTDLE